MFGAVEQSSNSMFPARLGFGRARSAVRGGYGADASASIEVGAGERMIQQHLNLYDLQGMWRDSPGKP
jgi:hypothetical protein